MVMTERRRATLARERARHTQHRKPVASSSTKPAKPPPMAADTAGGSPRAGSTGTGLARSGTSGSTRLRGSVTLGGALMAAVTLSSGAAE